MKALIILTLLLFAYPALSQTDKKATAVKEPKIAINTRITYLNDIQVRVAGSVVEIYQNGEVKVNVDNRPGYSIINTLDKERKVGVQVPCLRNLCVGAKVTYLNPVENKVTAVVQEVFSNGRARLRHDNSSNDKIDFFKTLVELGYPL